MLWGFANARVRAAIGDQDKAAAEILWRAWTALESRKQELADAQIAAANSQLAQRVDLLLQAQSPAMEALGSQLGDMVNAHGDIASALAATLHRMPVSQVAGSADALAGELAAVIPILKDIATALQHASLGSRVQAMSSQTSSFEDNVQQSLTQLRALREALSALTSVESRERSLMAHSLQAVAELHDSS